MKKKERDKLGDEHRSTRFKAIQEEVEHAFPMLRKVHVHRIAIYVLYKRGASLLQCGNEAASATIDHTAVAVRWTKEKVESDAEFAQKVRALCGSSAQI